MNNKIKLAIAVAVGIVGGGLIGTLGGGESTKQLGSASGRTGTTQPVAVCQKCEMWVDVDEFLTENPDFDSNMFLQVDPNYGPIE